MAAQPGLYLAWLETPEDTFSHDGAHLHWSSITLETLITLLNT